MNTRTLGLIALGLMAAATVASAAEYDWTYSNTISSVPFSGSGTLVAQDTLSTAYDSVLTGNLVTSISGTFDGSAITGLEPINTLGGNDNLINVGGFLLDGDGISFTISPSITDFGPDVNLYHGGPGYTDSGPTPFGAVFTLTPVPEPATLGLVGIGLAALGILRRRRAA